MNVGDIINAISSIGFPIVMCLILMNYVKESTLKQNEEIKELKDVINDMKEILRCIKERME